MKTIFTFLVLLFCVSTLFSQIPNAGFENWTGVSPNDWFANNVPPLWTTITKSTTVHGGTAAVRGDVVNTTSGIIPPYINSGLTGAGFSFTSRPVSLKGFYQLNSVQGDELNIAVSLYKGNSPVGAAGFDTEVSTSSYTQFAFDIYYFNAEIPDRCLIQVVLSNSTTDEHVGSYFLLDDLEFSDQAVGVNDNNVLNTFKLDQNYPNPFNPATRINYEIPSEDFTTLKIYDALGNEIAVLVNETKPAGSYYADFNASGLSNGIYFYKLTSGSSSTVRKMLLLK